ncbi:MAG: FAD-dependent monooxygenase [Deltaproteobacteria bacterium]|nr:FAD-dependent monooxygenase [Deltaproteobacteria bacterium]
MNAKQPDYDVIIVGSGPAGSSTALNLLARSPTLRERIVVLEKATHPRIKLCAGGVVPDVERCLGSVGLTLADIHTVSVDWAHMHYRGRGFRMRVARDEAFRVLRRNELDAYLADNVQRRGIRLEEHTEVSRVHVSDSMVSVETNRGRLVGRVVVGADGAKSVVRKHVGASHNSERRVARLVESLVPEMPSDPRMPAGDALFEFGCMANGVQGYFWNFPSHDGGDPRRTAGVYDSRAGGGDPRTSLRTIMQAEMEASGRDPTELVLEGHPLRWYDPNATIATHRVLLAGDAAGVDAVFGEGISLSLGYGEVAAEALAGALATGDLSFSDYAQRVRSSALGRSLLMRTRVAKILYRLRSPAIQRALIWYGGPFFRWFLSRYIFNWRPETMSTEHEQRRRFPIFDA